MDIWRKPPLLDDECPAFELIVFLQIFYAGRVLRNQEKERVQFTIVA